MAKLGQEGRSATAASSAAQPFCAPALAPVPTPVALLPDSLRYSSEASGSAVQFNRSVSAMPSQEVGNFARPSGQGTADTLLLR